MIPSDKTLLDYSTVYAQAIPKQAHTHNYTQVTTHTHTHTDF